MKLRIGDFFFWFLAVVAILMVVTTFVTIIRRSTNQQHPASELWNKFLACKVHYNYGDLTYSIDLTPEVKAMDGKKFTIDGFILPLEATSKFSHFLISKRSPTCPFCPPGAPNEIVEVFSGEPLPWQDSLMTVTGTMKLTDQKDMGIFLQMRDAAPVTK